MTLDELMALRIVQNPRCVPWLEESDPREFFSPSGHWGLMRTGGELVRFLIANGETLERRSCPVPAASDDEKRSSDIGEALLIGQSVRDELTLLLRNSEKQQKQINDMTEGIKFLAEQVKTMVDALAEDVDPDRPLTTYMSGKPI